MSTMPRGTAGHFDLPGLWPTEQQFLVLTAALSDGKRALVAFEKWRNGLDDGLKFDREVFRLLPLLYHNLTRCGCTDPLMARLKGVYRMSWVETHTMFDKMRPVVHELADARLDLLMLKGVPLGSQYYGNPALRPLRDIDLAVPARDALLASNILMGMGWRPASEPTEYQLRFRHDNPFYGPNGGEFDLHSRSFYEFADARADDEFRSTAVPFEFLERQLRAPDATRMLLHTIVHGVRWNPEPPIRWIADALTILRVSGAEIKWPEIAAFAYRWHLTYRLGLGLSYLTRYFDAPVPSDVLAEIERRRPTRIERIEALFFLQDETELRRKPFLGLILPLVSYYVRFAARQNPLRAIADFPKFLCACWELRRRREIIGFIARGIRKRILRQIHA